MKSPLIELRTRALTCLLECDPAAKVRMVLELAAHHRNGDWSVDADVALTAPAGIPGRPLKPDLVPPLQVGRRSMATNEGRAMLVHALAHIEFNAIKISLEYWIQTHSGEGPCLSPSRTHTSGSRRRSSPRATH